MKQKNINFEEIFKILKKNLKNKILPVVANPEWDKKIDTPYKTLISCILSLRTKDEVTEKAAYRLLKKYDNPQKLSRASTKKIKELIYPVGFYKTKSKTIKNISKKIVKEYNGKVPDRFEELLKFKGVGRKTANIVMVYGFKKTGFLPIDTHCHRIPNRLGWINTKTPEETEHDLKKIMPKKYWNDFNHLFVIFGQTICVPVSPFCSKCPIQNFCKKINVKKQR